MAGRSPVARHTPDWPDASVATQLSPSSQASSSPKTHVRLHRVPSVLVTHRAVRTSHSSSLVHSAPTTGASAGLWHSPDPREFGAQTRPSGHVTCPDPQRATHRAVPKLLVQVKSPGQAPEGSQLVEQRAPIHNPLAHSAWSSQGSAGRLVPRATHHACSGVSKHVCSSSQAAQVG